MKTNNDRHILSAAQISGMYSTSGGIRFVRIFGRVLLKEDAKGQWGRALTLICLAFENYCVKVNTDRPISQQPSCSSGILVPGSIKIMRVFARVREKRDFKRQWGRASCARL